MDMGRKKMSNETKYEIDEELENILDEYFPKGDKARGKALVLFAIANIRISKLKTEILELKKK